MAQTIRFAKKNKLFTASAIIALICAVAVLISAIAFGVYAIKAYIRDHADYTVTVIDRATRKEVVLEYTVEYGDMMEDDLLYIDLMPLKDVMGLVISGTQNKKKFTASGNTYMIFEDGNESAVVNGTTVALGGKASVTGNTCRIPFEFFRKSIARGFEIKIDGLSHAITIQQQYYDQKRTMKVELLLDETPFPPTEEFYLPMETQPPRLLFGYPIEIDGYLDYMYADHLLLVNKTSDKLDAAYDKSIKDQLVDLETLDGCAVADDGTAYSLQRDAAYALAAMMKAMFLEAPDTADTCVTSAYRSYTYQNWLFYEYYIPREAKRNPDATQEELEAIVSSYSARPGESEHQTGLCLDFTTASIGGKVDESFEDTPAFAWLSENAYKYGFILRYPEDKVDVTGYQYEAWHYRFVGVTAAVEIQKNGLCLEEYLAPAGS